MRLTDKQQQELIDAGGDHYRQRVADNPDLCADDLQTEAMDLAEGMLDGEQIDLAAELVFEGMLDAEKERSRKVKARSVPLSEIIAADTLLARDHIPGDSAWVIQVLVDDEWRDVRPTSAEDPYRFATKAQAVRYMKICYPDQVREARLGASEREAGVRVAPTVQAPNYAPDPEDEKGVGA